MIKLPHNPHKFPGVALVSCCLLVLSCAIHTLSAQDTGYFYNENRKVLVYGGNWYAYYLGKPESTERSSVYINYEPTRAEGADRPIHEGTLPLSRLQISPDGRFVSFIEHGRIENVDPDKANYIDESYDERGNRRRRYYEIISRLVVKPLEGTLPPKQIINSVYRYSWSNKGDKIAYLTGVYTEADNGFRNPKLWIYDLASQEPMETDISATEISWSKERLYLHDPTSKWGSSVMIYDPEHGTLEPSALKGIHISPVEDYHFHTTAETELRLFSHSTMVDVTAQHPELIKYSFIDPVWSPDGQALVFSNPEPSPTERLIIYNLKTRKVTEIGGVFAGFAPNRQSIAVVSPGKTQVKLEPWLESDAVGVRPPITQPISGNRKD